MKNIILSLLILLATSVNSFAANTFVQDYRTRGFASKVQDVVVDTQIQADYVARTDGQPVYLGYAIFGRSTSDDAWMIYKFTYDGNSQMTIKQTSYGTWTGRASLVYQ